MDKYFRQEILEEIGIGGQEKLAMAKVLIVGAGGLGSPVLTYLACAGVGNLYVADFDTVSVTNLNRQYLHGDEDVGKLKTASAKESIAKINKDVNVYEINEKITEENVLELIKDKDVVINCVDNIPTRVILNRACVINSVPLIEAAIDGFYGFMFVISDVSPCLNCIGYEKTKLKTPIPVIGTTAGIIGTLQANECIKIIVSAGENVVGRLLAYDGLEGSFEEVPIHISKECSVHRELQGEK